MFTFVGSDVRYCGEDISTMSRGSLDAVSMVNSPLPSFVVDVEVLEIIVEIDGTGA